MSFDLGQALLGALGGLGQGLEYEGKQQQAMADQQQTQQMNEQAWEMRQKWLEQNSPQKTRTETVADPNNPGSNKVLNEHWEPASADEPAQWLVDSTANDPNTMRLNEKSDEAAQRNEMALEKLKQQQEMGDQRNQIAAERISLEADRIKNAKANGANGLSFEDYLNLSPDQQALYNQYRRGEVDPSTKADLEARRKTLSETSPDSTDSDRANTLYQNQKVMGVNPFKSVQGGVSGGALSQISGSGPQSKAAALQAQAAAAIQRGADPAQVKARLAQLLGQQDNG